MGSNSGSDAAAVSRQASAFHAVCKLCWHHDFADCTHPKVAQEEGEVDVHVDNGLEVSQQSQAAIGQPNHGVGHIQHLLHLALQGPDRESTRQQGAALQALWKAAVAGRWRSCWAAAVLGQGIAVRTPQTRAGAAAKDCMGLLYDPFMITCAGCGACHGHLQLSTPEEQKGLELRSL